jgi:hypothetical protein
VRVRCGLGAGYLINPMGDPCGTLMSPQARTFFKSSCVQVGIKPLELILWIRTRWASLYKFIDRLLRLWKVSRHSPLVFVFV